MHKTVIHWFLKILITVISLSPVNSIANKQGNIKGESALGLQKSADCVACHGVDGNSIVANFPKIAGQHSSYLVKSLSSYRDGTRDNSIMAGIAEKLTDKDIADLAAYFSGKDMSYGAADPELVVRGEQIYRFGDFDKQISACIACHGPTGTGVASAIFPALGGQWSDYLISQLKLFHSDARKNNMMNGVAANLSEEDMKAVASYIEGLRK